MRTLRFALLIILGLAMMLIIAANMAPVDLHLAPKAMGLDGLSLMGVPLALVIVLAAVGGFLVGLLIEYIREAKHRSLLEEKRREINRLRDENAKLAEQLGVDAEEQALLAS